VTTALSALRLARFRSYAEAQLELDGRPVVLFGLNGAGKTNLLEAVSLLAPGRGLRGAAVDEIARRIPGVEPEGVWAVSADVVREDGDVARVGVGQDPANPTRKLVRIDGAPATQADLARLAGVAWLTPAQDRVFAGPRGERLKFFDRLVLALRHEHGTSAARYEQAMRERGRLLDEGRADPAWLDALEAEMAERGTALTAARVELLGRLQAAINERPEGAFPKADLALAGEATGGLEARLAQGEDPAAVQADLAAALKDARRRDAAAKRTLTGPHRADFAAVHRAKAMPAGACSTGEQKALLVGLALAHARALAGGRGGSPPLLLLDEAAAHLDADRRAALIEELLALGSQSWLTGTDESLFAAFGDRAQRFRVADGRAEAA
jgi:DNA replication and repair protein RecF